MQIMLVAPGDDADRTWLKVDPERARTVAWEPRRSGQIAPGPGVEDHWLPAPARTATLRAGRAPGWRIALRFLVAAGEVPQGYVMPGWVEGEPCEFVPVCTYCYGHVMPMVGAWMPGARPLGRHSEHQCAEARRARGMAIVRVSSL